MTEDVCGETYDHDLRLIDERDGMRTFECQECGAEIVEEYEDERAKRTRGDHE